MSTAEAEVRQSTNGVEKHAEISAPPTAPPPAPDPLDERIEKMTQGLNSIKARRVDIERQVRDLENELDQIKESVLRTEGALYMLQAERQQRQQQ